MEEEGRTGSRGGGGVGAMIVAEEGRPAVGEEKQEFCVALND